ncbi:hypothetical protein [Paenibacillus thalictri]|uniref:YgiT-type zinc finger protein n=1 Tax=Paenibacillus thalictri TaxID=2527873 RepID=A0A4Q9DN25_9BACL|nr:hypothetical protein [Paenibacillus thalictri]TBL76254.1 hypothetical protein EYB31_19820 [Paenibacillus thalictri]
MSYSVATIGKDSEGLMRKSRAKCECGSSAELQYKAKLGRFGIHKVTVFNVPVYSCNGCGNSFMNGSDAKKFAKRIEDAVKSNLIEINFD